MSRYIDADALMKEIKMDIADNGLTERYVFYRINEAPSIDVVRCKECRLWWRTTGSNYGDCRHFGLDTIENDYCSYGERKE